MSHPLPVRNDDSNTERSSPDFRPVAKTSIKSIPLGELVIFVALLAFHTSLWWRQNAKISDWFTITFSFQPMEFLINIVVAQ